MTQPTAAPAAAVEKEPAAAPAADTTTKPAATDSKAPDTKDKATAPAAEADKGEAKLESEAAESDDGEDTDFLDGDEEGAETDAADAKDGKEAADKKPVSTFDRDSVLKAAETQYIAKAKTDEQKKAATEKLERLKKKLARYATPEAALMGLFEADEKVRGNQVKAKPGENATPEEIAEYRKENDLPLTAKDIDVRVPNHKWEEHDQPLIDAFQQVAFEEDIPQKTATKLVNMFLGMGNTAQDFQKQAHEAIDREDKKVAKAELKDEWGEEFQPRLGLVDRIFKDPEVFPDGLGEKIWNSRTPDGHMLRNSPSFIRLFGEVAVDRYGEGSIMTGNSRDNLQSEEDRIRTILKTDADRYYAEGHDKKLTEILNKKSAAGGRRRSA